MLLGSFRFVNNTNISFQKVVDIIEMVRLSKDKGLRGIIPGMLVEKGPKEEGRRLDSLNYEILSCQDRLSSIWHLGKIALNK